LEDLREIPLEGDVCRFGHRKMPKTIVSPGQRLTGPGLTESHHLGDCPLTRVLARLYSVQSNPGDSRRAPRPGNSYRERNVQDNPFTYGNPIRDSSRFFGRVREAEQIFGRLRNPEFESNSVVGDRRIGKTSLLNYVASPAVRAAHGLGTDNYTFIYADLAMVGGAMGRGNRRLAGVVGGPSSRTGIKSGREQTPRESCRYQRVLHGV
jgi:hypothetical protein